ncbi:glycoside hydrolase family 16 protein [Robertkochia aurantiaca]|uniref:glycoside hydrolase family 16 protein n=1 Tax=Robertkochia aurantiaca TaxID=2873700 RepID=UPI001CCC5740|nr:glycoside hydrolase family 16 protein [Robertkochia sp. 3YJGBD-33]
MNIFKLIYRLSGLWLLAIILVSCEEDLAELDPIITPSNLEVAVDIVGADADNPYGDGSGSVHFTASADDALGYQFIFNGETRAVPSGETTFNFSNTGLFTYNVSVVAVGTGGISTSKNVGVEVLVTYQPPADLLQMLVGDGSRTWRIKSEASGHFGLGPVGGNIPTEWYGAGPEEKTGVGMYDDRYIFNADGTFTHITDETTDTPEGTVFGREVLIEELAGPGGEAQGADIINYPYNDYQEVWALSEPNGVETLSLSGTGFLGYYTGGDHRYEIFSRSADEMIVKTTDGNNEFDWWFILIATDAGAGGGSEPSGNNFDELIWAREFDTPGAPDATVWNYELGDGCPDLCGWGNNEAQYYTDSPDNIRIEDGYLKITAIKEAVGGKEYTSARITTKDNFSFTYGRVEVRAKMPQGGGTWPAFWMLGSDIDTNPWPGAGEIDIMEFTGNNPETILGTTHDPNNFAGNARTGSTTVADATTAFHTYAMEWSETSIDFYVDDEMYHSVSNNADLPFNKDFFLILNMAMGGTLGGDIDPDFTSATMEIDYVRVYQ